MKDSFLNVQELKELGLKSFGENVKISKFARLYSPENIVLGNNVRIDDFCILSGKITLGSYIHISAFSALYGSKGILMDDYSGLSPRTIIFSATDDFSGKYLINPMVPKELTLVTGGLVTISKYCQIGSNSIVLPNLTVNEGAVVGAMSLVKDNLEEWSIFAGIPAVFIKERSRDLLFKLSKNE